MSHSNKAELKKLRTRNEILEITCKGRTESLAHLEAELKIHKDALNMACVGDCFGVEYFLEKARDAERRDAEQEEGTN